MNISIIFGNFQTKNKIKYRMKPSCCWEKSHIIAIKRKYIEKYLDIVKGLKLIEWWFLVPIKCEHEKGLNQFISGMYRIVLSQQKNETFL